MNIRLTLTALVLTVSCFGCAPKLKVEDALKTSGVICEGYSRVLIIPYHGCSTCVSKAMAYLKAHVDNRDELFVFTNYTSKKEIRIRLRLSTEQSERLLFIGDNKELLQSGVSHFYPSLVTKESGEWQIKISDPNNLGVLN